MPKFHVKKGDQVTVIAGKEKGKSGKIIAVLTEKQRVVVEGLPHRRHYRARGFHSHFQCEKSGGGHRLTDLKDFSRPNP
jgi:ribosomal protein L24